MERIIPGS
ncbi:hypothetical protein LINPERHAP2_LOCUS11358 [Linum perenne]